jgi:O-antigen/teichoic acid export membrane protein
MVGEERARVKHRVTAATTACAGPPAAAMMLTGMLGRSSAKIGSGSTAPSGAALARASALNLLARLASGGATLGIAVVTTNVLDTTGRGVYAILATCAGIGATIITGGTTVLAADLIHGRHDERALHGATTAIGVASALALCPLAIAVAWVTGDVTVAALTWSAVVTALVSYSSYEMSIAQARGDVLVVSLTDLAMALFPLVATILVAVLMEPTVTTLMAAWAAGALLTASVQFALAAGSARVRRSWRLALSILRRSVRVAIANGASILCSRIDVLVVAAVLSASAAGIYSIPVALAGSLLLLSRSLLTATYHSIMTAPPDEVAARLSSALRHSVIVVLVGGGLSVPAVAVAAGFVFGDAYSAIWRPYGVLVLGSVCICVVEVLRHYLLTRLERQGEFVLVVTGMLVANGVLAALGAAAFGIMGAALATTVTYAVAAFVLLALCARTLDVPMGPLALPRRSDLAAYWRAGRSILNRRRSAAAIGRD